MNKITQILLAQIAGPLYLAIKNPTNKASWQMAVIWGYTLASQFISISKMPSEECVLGAFDQYFDQIKATITGCTQTKVK